MSKLMDHFSFSLINDYENLNFGCSLQASQILTINRFDYLTFNYFIICFDENLILINNSDICKINQFFHSDKKLTIFSLSTDIKPLFYDIVQKNNPNPNNLIYVEQDIISKEEIESFSSQFEIKNKEIQEIWKLIRQNISAYLVQKSYIDSFSDRIKNYKEMLNSQPIEKIIKKDEIIYLRNIYTGNTSKVTLVYYIPQEKIFVIKNIKEEYHYLFTREHNNYLTCNHPFLPIYNGIVECDSEKYLAIEYIQGNSLNLLYKIQLNLYEKIKIVFELLIVFHYLHSKNFIYRDLKPNNLIIDNNHNIVLIDFDKMIENLNENFESELTNDFTNFGAPEFSSHSNNYSSKADIYSIGLIIKYIFFNDQMQAEYQNEYLILKGFYGLCINSDPKKRPNISELIDLFYDKIFSYFSKEIQDNCLLYNDLGIMFEHSYQKPLNNFGIFHLYKLESNLRYQKGIHYLQVAANHNCREAQYNLGFIYYEGKFIQRNVNKAIKYLSLAANQNLAIAQFVLGILYYKGRYIEHDINKSVYYLKLSLNNKYVDAFYTIGLHYLNENKLIKCFDKNIHFMRIASRNVDIVVCEEGFFKSIAYFEQAANQNDAYSQLALGLLYYKNNVIPHDIKKALHYFTLASNQNQIDSLFYLGEIYNNGDKFKRNIKKSIHYFNLAANYDLSKSKNTIELINSNGNLIIKRIIKREFDFIPEIVVKANAQYELGNIYFYGKDIEKDTSKGIYYLHLSAYNNNPHAQDLLGSIYLEGIYTKKNVPQAINLLLRAANQNLTKSECTLGCIYYEGIDVKQDINKAIHFLKLAASKNSCIAQFVLAEIHIIIFKDINKALYYYEQAAEQNYMPAQNTLGVLYYQGKLAKRNIKKALYYFNLAANQKFSKAQYNLGYIYYDGSYVCRDINLAIKYFSLAAEQNEENSQHYLGLLFYDNKYIQRNIDKSIYYFTLAAEQNLPEAQYMLGYIYSNVVLPKDIKKAIHYYSLAAYNNFNEAIYGLGMIYIKGEGVLQDINKGIEYLTRASKNNFQISQNILGIYYYFGTYVSQNIRKGIKYFEMAAKGYHGQNASFILGNIYLKGKYVTQDVDKAIYYYKESSCFNNQYAKNNLGIIYKNGIEKPSKIADSIEFFKEAVRQKNDPISMYNLAHIYFYNEGVKADFQTTVNLLVNSYYSGFTYSKFLLFLVLYKKNNYLTSQIIKEEISKTRKEIKKLSKELSDFINKFRNYSILYDIVKKYDFIYDDRIKPEFLQDFLSDKMVKISQKNANKMFCEGFGFTA